MDAEVVVLGAGPAGLGAALWASRAGHRVIVLERAHRVGGAAASIEVGGLRVDFGSHRLHPATDPAILAELRGLLGDDLQRRPRNGRIRLEGRWLAFPLRATDLVRSLPAGFALAALRDAALARTRTPAEDTYAEVIRARLGPTMADRFYNPYARKIWGAAPQALDGEQARRRVGATSASSLLARVVRGATPGARPHFHYPRRGFGQLSEALADAARAAGAEIRLDHNVEHVTHDERVVTVVTGRGSVRARRLWSTLPLPALARVAEPGPPPSVREAADHLVFRAMVLVYLVLDVDRFTPFDAHYLPGPETPITRLSEPKNYRDSAEDPPGRTVLCAELPCTTGQGYWTMGDQELGELVVDGLRAVGLPEARPVEVAVQRLSHAYPVYRAGAGEAFRALDAWVSAHPRLLTFGRQGLFAHDNTHHALAMARAAAEALRPDGSFEAAAWAAARLRFAEHVVED